MDRVRGRMLAGVLLLLVVGLPAALLADEQNEVTEIIAHRGASWLAPENTLVSLALGWELGADAVECDIYLTGDGEVVLMHDADTERTTGVSYDVERTEWEALRELDAGRWKGEHWAGQKIPTLAEALALTPEGKPVFIDVKSGVEVVEPMLEVIEESGLAKEQAVVIAFSYEVARETKAADPDLPVYLLAGFRQDEETGAWSPTIDELIEMALEANLDGLNLQANEPSWTAEAGEAIREAGLEFYCWTVNDADLAWRMTTEAGVDGITTDRPGWLRKRLEQRLEAEAAAVP